MPYLEYFKGITDTMTLSLNLTKNPETCPQGHAFVGSMIDCTSGVQASQKLPVRGDNEHHHRY